MAPSVPPSRQRGPVVFVSDASGFGGAEILAADLAVALAARGHEVRFVVSAGAPGAERLAARLGPVPLLHAPLAHKSSYRARLAGALADVPRAVRLAAALRRLQPSVLVINQPDPEDGHAVALAASMLRPRPRILGLLHLPQPLETLGARRFAGARTATARLAYRTLYDRVVAISAASAREAGERWAPRSRVAACPNGIPLPAAERPGERAAAREALGLPPDAEVLGFLGRLTLEQKGLDVLVASMRRLLLVRPALLLAVAGDGPDRGWLEGELRAAGIERSVRLLGWKDPRQLLVAADLLLLPSRFEGLPLVILEAGALGKDVIATTVGGVPELLEPSALAPAGDAGAFTAVVLAALQDPAASAARAARLAELVRSRHSIEAMAARFAPLLDELPR